MKIPYNNLAHDEIPFQEEIQELLRQIIRSGRFVGGSVVEAFEEQLGKRVGRHAVSCDCGTDALVLALKAAGVQRGDEVVVPSFTFVSTVEAVSLAGATPRFADSRLSDFGLDPISALSLINERTKAAIPAGLYGDATSVADTVRELSSSSPALQIIEDAAQSLGGEVEGVPSGALSHWATSSFYPTKPLGCYGEGGVVFASTLEGAERLRSLRNHGLSSDGLYREVGMNSRLDAFQAAVLLTKLQRFDETIERRNRMAQRYHALLEPLENREVLIRPAVKSGTRSSWAQYTVRILDGQRDRVKNSLREQGIETAIYYSRPLHLHPAYQEFGGGRGALPVAEKLSAEVLSLPLYLSLQPEEQEKIAEALSALL